MIKATFEHLAFSVPDTEKMAQWCCDHLGMKKVRHDPGKKLSLADHTGTVVLELYSNHDKPMIPLAE
jgi:catechol 2,3-dioxygenase-like lactoylglutathione lyase family enzyme